MNHRPKNPPNTMTTSHIPTQPNYSRAFWQEKDWLDRRAEEAREAYEESCIPDSTSNCCGELIQRNGLCSECKEHCIDVKEEDPTPYCSYCRARWKSACDCGPIAENE